MPEESRVEVPNSKIGISFLIISLIIVGIVVFARELAFPSSTEMQLESVTLSKGEELAVECPTQPLEVKQENGIVHVYCGAQEAKKTQTNIVVPDLPEGIEPTSVAPTSFFSATATPVATPSGFIITVTP